MCGSVQERSGLPGPLLVPKSLERNSAQLILPVLLRSLDGQRLSPELRRQFLAVVSRPSGRTTLAKRSAPRSFNASFPSVVPTADFLGLFPKKLSRSRDPLQFRPGVVVDLNAVVAVPVFRAA